jgi:hypothetical protein
MKANATRRVMLAVAGAAVLALTSGCAWSIGGKREGALSVRPTRGQELIDLKRAKEQGAITDEEYEKQKTQILEHSTAQP